MSELKVLVDGKERKIQGLNQETTTESVILVLAKATGKSGKLALIEKWRDLERILPSDECPLKCLHSWGSYRDDVSLVLQDNHSSNFNSFNKEAINLNGDDKDYLLAKSLDSDSQEDFAALQQRKLQRLERAIEILDLQTTCWDGNDEAFLYLTDEEIIEDLEVKLTKALKLQGKELVEFETWENELRDLEQTRDNLFRQREIFTEKFANLEERIAEAYDAIDMLLEDLEKSENGNIELDKSSDEFIIQQELEQISKELSQQSALFRKQDHELTLIKSTISHLERSIQGKNSKITKLKEEIDLRKNDFQIAENFLPKLPEAESRLQTEDNIGLSVNNSTISNSGLKDQVDNRKVFLSASEKDSLSTTARDKDNDDTNLLKLNQKLHEDQHLSNQNSSQRFTSKSVSSSSKLHQDDSASERNSKELNSKDKNTTYSLSSLQNSPTSENAASPLTWSNFNTTAAKPFAANSRVASSDSPVTYTPVIDTLPQDTVSLSESVFSDTSTICSSPQISTSLSNSAEEEIYSTLTNDYSAIPEYLTKNQERDSTLKNESSTLDDFSPVATSSHNTTELSSTEDLHFTPERNSTSSNYVENDFTASAKQGLYNPKDKLPPSQSYISRKESFKKIRDVFERKEGHSFSHKDKYPKDVNLRKSSFEKPNGFSFIKEGKSEKEELSNRRKLSVGEKVEKFSDRQERFNNENESFAEADMSGSAKPATLPKPVRNSVLAPQLGNLPQPLQEKLNNDIAIINSHPKKTFIEAPKPYGSYVASLGASPSHGNFKTVGKLHGESFGSKMRTASKPSGSYVDTSRKGHFQGNFKLTEKSCDESYGNHEAPMEPCALEHELKQAPRPYSGSVEKSKSLGKITNELPGDRALILKTNELQNESNAFNYVVQTSDSSSEQDDTVISSKNNPSNFDSSLFQKKSKLLAQPYINNTTKLPLSPLMKSKHSLSQSHYHSRNHLSPPTAIYHKRHSSEKNTMINNGETTEPGIFV